MRWHCPPDTKLEIRALAVWGRARYLSVKEAPHIIEYLRVQLEEAFCGVYSRDRGLSVGLPPPPDPSPSGFATYNIPTVGSNPPDPTPSGFATYNIPCFFFVFFYFYKHILLRNWNRCKIVIRGFVRWVVTWWLVSCRFRAGCCSWCGGGGGAALRLVIKVSVDPFKWKSGQEKMYCDSMKQL